MKKNILITAASAAIFTVSSMAGEHMAAPSKTVVQPAPIVYGTGAYFGIQAGINAYQDFGGTRRYNVNGNSVAIDANDKIGGVGGIKVGYVFDKGLFGTATIRPAVEADLFYNGVQCDLDLRVNGNTTGFNAQADLNSIALLGNFLLRFGTGQFQPYVGVGVGGFWGEADDVQVTIGGRTFNGDGSNNSGFAWQIIAGADYYLNERTSLFAEYKYLTYEDAGPINDSVGQQLVVLGARWHF